MTQSSTRASSNAWRSAHVARGRSRRSPSWTAGPSSTRNNELPGEIAGGRLRDGKLVLGKELELTRRFTLRGRIRGAGVAVLLFLGWMACPAVADTDMQGRTVTPPSPAKRVISLVPSITETAFALERGDRLVGRTIFCEYPPEAKALPTVGDMANPSTEAVLVLEPDLILASDFGVNQGPLETFNSMKLPIYYLDFRDYDASLESIRRMGGLLDAKEQAETIVSGILAAEGDVRQRTAGLDRPKVLIAVMHGPVWVAGTETFLDRLITAAGGTNAAAPHKGYGPLETEGILLAAPDVVLVAEVPGQLPSAMSFWNSPELASLPARKASRVVPLSPRETVPGPHIRQSFYNVLRAIHPEVVRPTDPQSELPAGTPGATAEDPAQAGPVSAGTPAATRGDPAQTRPASVGTPAATAPATGSPVPTQRRASIGAVQPEAAPGTTPSGGRR